MDFLQSLDWMQILRAFIVGGLICVVGQILIDKTKLTPGHITSLFVLIGIILEAFGIYSILIEYLPGGAGMPILNFGYLLANSVKKGVVENGIIGIFKNMFVPVSASLSIVLLSGVIAGFISKLKP